MMDNKENRDILDVSTPSEASYPEENMPKTAERPVVDPSAVSPQEGGYFLNKFLEKSDEQSSEDADEPIAVALPPAADADELKGRIVAALQEIYDPEIPVNIYELGLIYDVDVAADYSVNIRMTLTTPHCPVAETMPGEVEMRVASVDGVKSVEVKLVWEPAWDMSLMSDEARLELGLL